MNFERYRSRLKKLPFVGKIHFAQTGEDGEAGGAAVWHGHHVIRRSTYLGPETKNVCSAAKARPSKLIRQARFKYKMEVEVS